MQNQKFSIRKLVISWGVSKGRETYGYNICRAEDVATGKRYRTCGGGYDMVGTVVADAITDIYQAELQTFVATQNLVDCGYQVAGYKKIEGLYGLQVNPKGFVSIDGMCGINSVQRIAEAMGFEWLSTYKRKHCTEAFYLSKAL